MTARDLDRVVAIEHAVFPAPWSRASFETEVSGEGGGVPWVAERDGAVIGYLISWIVADEIHIGNIAVAGVARREGVATELLRNSLADAADRGVALATLEVRASNRRAMGLYEKFGFMPVAMRKKYYSDSGEDAIVMVKQFALEGAA